MGGTPLLTFLLSFCLYLKMFLLLAGVLLIDWLLGHLGSFRDMSDGYGAMRVCVWASHLFYI